MTRDEAKEAIESGKKISHRYFTPEEYVMLSSDGSGRYETEEGYIINPGLFWIDRRSDAFQIDWEIWNPPSSNVA